MSVTSVNIVLVILDRLEPLNTGESSLARLGSREEKGRGEVREGRSERGDGRWELEVEGRGEWQGLQRGGQRGKGEGRSGEVRGERERGGQRGERGKGRGEVR